MENAAQDAIASIGTGFDAVWALVIAYSFSVLGAVMLMVVGYIVAGLVERGISGGLSRLPGFDGTLRHFFATAARYAVLVLVLVMVLGQFGVQTASIIAAIGAIGLAIGLALQGTLQNIAAGIMLLVLRPFRIGESIEVGSISGEVEEVGLFATKLRAADGIYILAPNSKLWNEPVRNSTRNRLRRNDIAVNIRYGDDIDAAERLLTELAAADLRVKKQPAPLAFVNALNDGSIQMALRYWTSDTDFFRAKLDLTKLARTRLAKRGIGFPEPVTAVAEEAEVDRDAMPEKERAERRPTRQ
ncbi:mechanosensitive ion channel [Mesorhizobium sp. LHD-90]|uniref:mechanosensitive ion channel family protein n=1 Tax=Mesorhizobium sp. LHD-90 TaxID=3071414 RepID=UPI0027DF2B25|nr:mechanosensitive ion channel domain-containing protein [Mesorhizobium sp. LHD-90]MDQ6432500.1 mechanosensitive ion channel [Mesorhizobium sp. LHD-90]